MDMCKACCSPDDVYGMKCDVYCLKDLIKCKWEGEMPEWGYSVTVVQSVCM